MTRICTICARGGSKGVPNKNLRKLAGTPLIAYSIQQARQSAIFDCIAASSDATDILSVAADCGVDQLIDRPPELATDEAGKVPAIVHCVEEVEHRTGLHFETIVDLDVTSPLRLPEDIVGAVRLLEDRNVSNVITGARARRSPYFNLVEVDSSGVVRLSKPPEAEVLSRQASPKCFDMNASVYVWRRSAFFRGAAIFGPDTLLYVMPEDRSIDIDSELDFELVEYLMARRMERWPQTAIEIPSTSPASASS